MNLIKTSFYTSISTAITFLSGFVVTKVVAVKIGPAGMAYVGQFQNTTAILTMLATGAVASGVVKYLAQYKDDLERRQQIVNTAFIIVAISSTVVSLAVMALSTQLSVAAFKTADFWIVYLLLGIFTMTVAFNVIFSSILNGLKEIRKLTIVNITSSLVGVGLTVLLAHYYGVKGVLVSSTLLSVFIFLLYLYMFKKAAIPFTITLKNWDRPVAKMLFAFTFMAVVSGLLVPFIQILVRDKIMRDFSSEVGGYWQAVTRISDYYLTFVTMVLGVYYMPKLSELQQRSELRQEIFRAYRYVMPVVTVIAILIWVCRDLIIHILFAPTFGPMKPLFTFQLLGDVFKIASWLLAILMISKAMIKTYIVTEFVFAGTYVLFCYYFINRFGVIGATYGFCLNYTLYWIVTFFITKKFFTIT